MTEEHYTLEETDFEDPIPEIAGEPENITTIQKCEITHEPHVSLKPDIEEKRVKSYSCHLFRMLKTIEEVQVSTSHTESPAIEPRPPVTSYIPLMHGKNNHLYQTISITESPIEPRGKDKNPSLMSDELFEDAPPAMNTVAGRVPRRTMLISKSSPHIRTSPDTPSNVDFNIGKWLNRTEHDIYSNFMKMQKM